MVRSNVDGPRKIMSQYDSFMDLFHLDVNQYIKEFGMMEKPLADYSEQINEYHARVLEAQVRTENVIDCNLVRVMVFDFKQTFIDRAEYVCTCLKSQVAPLLSLSLLHCFFHGITNVRACIPRGTIYALFSLEC